MVVNIRMHPDARIHGDKEKVRDAILDIYHRNGSLTPQALIKEAKKRSSPLHGEFTWDADVALKRIQRQEALYLIRVVSLEITPVNSEKTYSGREFIISKSSGNDEYVSVRTALSDAEMREQTINFLQQRLDRLLQELERFQEFNEVVQAITKTRSGRKKKAA